MVRRDASGILAKRMLLAVVVVGVVPVLLVAPVLLGLHRLRNPRAARISQLP